MGKKDLGQVNKLKKLGIFRSEDAAKVAGISWATLSRLTRDGLIRRVARGFYMHPQAHLEPEDLDFAVACAHFGSKATIGGLSALSHYGLIEQVPNQIWVVVPAATRDQAKKSRYKCLRTTTNHKIGIEKAKHFRITSIERTLVESLKFASKIGPRIAIKASKKAIMDGLTSEAKIGKMAKQLKMQKILEKYWEAIVA